MEDVRIIVTGGTIDKVHDPLTESLVFARDGSTHIKLEENLMQAAGLPMRIV